MPLPPDQRGRLPPDDPNEWLNRARSNPQRALNESPEIYLEDLCFDAQQAAEKALKAVLLARTVAIPYSHDLSRLLTLLEADGVEVPPDVRAAARLTRYAVTTRYPGPDEPVTNEEHRDAVRIATATVSWAHAHLGQPS